MQPLDVLFIALAAFYAAYVITATPGPFHLFVTLRARLPVGVFTCFVCCVFWCSLAFYLLNLIYAPITMVFAGAGATLLAYRYTGGDRV